MGPQRTRKKRTKSLTKAQKGNRRSLHCATPNFLLSLVALAIFMRLSLKKAAHVAISSAARQEIRVRSGPTASRGRRDDKVVGPSTDVHPLDNWHFPCNKFVIS